MGFSLDQVVDTFSQQDFDLLGDKDFLLKKKELTSRIVKKLKSVQSRISETLSESNFQYPEGIKLKSGKISKGENYKGLPYFVLDFPALYTKNDVFAFRILIWWGNAIIYSLHLQGSILEKYRNILINYQNELDGFYLCVGDSPWEYDFIEGNYQPIDQIDPDIFNSTVLGHPFLKIAKNADFTDLNRLELDANEHLLAFLRTLSHS